MTRGDGCLDTAFRHPSTATPQDVPIIDMSAPEAAAAAAVRAAAAGSGFFYVTQHGVSDQLVAEAFAQQRALFALPQETKMALLQDANNRGYTPFRVRRGLGAAEEGRGQGGIAGCLHAVCLGERFAPP